MKKINTILFFLLLSYGVKAQTGNLQSLISPYLGIKEALVNNNATLAAKHAQAWIDSLDRLAPGIQANTQDPQLRQSAKLIAGTSNLEKQRTAFAELSKSFWATLKNGSYTGDKLYYDYCPMKKAYWISKDPAIRNPYYGAKMLTCGNIHEKLQ